MYKGGNACSVENCRPIALTRVRSNITERVTVANMLNYLCINNLISHHQHGFLRKRSTVTNLRECLHDWTFALNDKHGVTVPYIDYGV